MIGVLSKARAYKNESAGRLSIMAYLQLIIMSLFDLLLFNTTYTTKDIIGTSIILTVNIIAGLSVKSAKTKSTWMNNYT